MVTPQPLVYDFFQCQVETKKKYFFENVSLADSYNIKIVLYYEISLSFLLVLKWSFFYETKGTIVIGFVSS